MMFEAIAPLLLTLCVSYTSCVPDAVLTKDQVRDFIRHTWDTKAMGAVAIIVGLFLCFLGKRFFKVFLGLIGAVAGGAVGMIINTNMMAKYGEDATLLSWLVCLGMAAVVAVLAVYFWRVGIYIAGALGGFHLALFILATNGGLVEDDRIRLAIIVSGAVLGAVAAHFLEEIAVVAASSITGALLATIGLDCIINKGFAVYIYNQIQNRHFEMPLYSEFQFDVWGLFVITIGLAAAGAASQLIFNRKSGFGRYA